MTMQPGPELDRKIAEMMGIFGTRLEDGKVFIDPDSETKRCCRYSDPHCIGPYEPSRRIDQAWEVVERLKEMGHAFTLCDVPVFSSAQRGPRAMFQIGVLPPTKDDAIWTAEAETMPHAICLAALAAVGVDVDA